jgi:hypothetical protein
MYGATGDGDLVELKETLFAKEVDLQDFLSKHPALLAGDQMNPTDPRRFVLITAEAGVAIKEAGSDYFSLDHLFIDQDGIPTLVEVKRSTDTRGRREVVGQLLEYAANACAYWNVEKLRDTFERRCAAAYLSPGDELAKLRTAPDIDPEAIWEKVAQNLKQERLRLVFLSDKFSPETQRIIEFLNRQMESSEAFAVEVPQYTGGGLRTLVPRVLNPSVLQADRRAIAAGRGEAWTAERFYDDLSSRCGPEAVQVFRTIRDWAEGQPLLTTYFGRGKSDGSITVAHADDNTVIVTLWTYGRVEIDFEYLIKSQQFKPDVKRQELRERLMSGSTLDIPEARIDKRPSIQWSDLTDAKNIKALLASVEWVAQELVSTEGAAKP